MCWVCRIYPKLRDYLVEKTSAKNRQGNATEADQRWARGEFFSISCCHYAARRSCALSLLHAVFHKTNPPPSEFSWPLTFFAHEGCVFFFVFLWSRLLSSLSLLAWFVTQSQRENKPVPVYCTTLTVSLGRGKPVCALSFCSHCAAEWDLPTGVVGEQCGGGMHCVSS